MRIHCFLGRLNSEGEYSRILKKTNDILDAEIDRAAPGSEFHRIKTGLDFEYFPTEEECFHRLLEEPWDTAHWGTIETVLASESIRCRVTTAWASSMPRHLTMALQKGSPLRQFFDFHLLRIRESGRMEILHRRWKDSRDCQQQQMDISLGYDKLVFLFSLLVAGFAVSVLIYLMEQLMGFAYAKGTAEKEPAAVVRTAVGSVLEGFGIENRLLETELEDLLSDVQRECS